MRCKRRELASLLGISSQSVYSFSICNCKFFPTPAREDPAGDAFSGRWHIATTMNRYLHPERVAILIVLLLPTCIAGESVKQHR
jgi:hypothetical protein